LHDRHHAVTFNPIIWPSRWESRVTHKKINVLVVDDEQAIRELIVMGASKRWYDGALRRKR